MEVARTAVASQRAVRRVRVASPAQEVLVSGL